MGRQLAELCVAEEDQRTGATRRLEWLITHNAGLQPVIVNDCRSKLNLTSLAYRGKLPEIEALVILDDQVFHHP